MTRKLCAILLLGISILPAMPGNAQGTREGIAVHGDWVIEVRNPDGSLSERREFKNGLTLGALNLAKLLTGEHSMAPGGFWRVILYGSTGGYQDRDAAASPFRRENIAPVPGRITRPDDYLDDTMRSFATLDPVVRVAPTQGASRTQVLLSGFAKADVNGSIARVDTIMAVCAPTCNLSGDFTGTDLKAGGSGPDAAVPRPLQIVAGQIVQVTVRISFSSGS